MKKILFVSAVCCGFLLNVEAENQTYISSEEINEIAEQTRLNTGAIDELKQTIKELQQKIEALEKGAHEEKSNQETQSEIKGKSADEVTKMAVSLIDENQTEKARCILEAYIKDHPKDHHCDTMYSHIGESYFREKNYKDAAAAFMQSYELNPSGKKCPECLYKLALCFGELGKKGPMKETLQRIIDSYPKSDSAKRAKEKLKQLN